MLELFDIVYKKNEECTLTDLTDLKEELRQLKFKNIQINKLYSYVLFESNGGLFMNGEREFQMFSTKEIPRVYKEYGFAKYMSFALPISIDGNGNFALFDHRKPHEKRIYCVSAGNLGWEKDSCFYLAENFKDYIQQSDGIFNYM